MGLHLPTPLYNQIIFFCKGVITGSVLTIYFTSTLVFLGVQYQVWDLLFN